LPRWPVQALAVVFLCACASAAAASTTGPTASPASPRKSYLLKARPAVGQRIAYEQSTGSTLKYTVVTDADNRRIATDEKTHEQLVVTSEEILELGEPPAVTKRVTFGSNCWSATKTNNKPTRKTRLIYADKTVTFKIDKEGTFEQDFGVKPTREQTEVLRNLFVVAKDLYPAHPVAVGDRWCADDAMRGLLGLQPGDTASAFFTLKEVRKHDGRDVAVVEVRAGVIQAHVRGFNMELSLSGSWMIDLETGCELKIDLIGQSTLAGLPQGRRGQSTRLNVTGEGTFEFHRAARLLPAAENVADVAAAP
jgi:hypothetical protein